MQRVISYEKVSPAVLGSIVESVSNNILCFWTDADEDTFIFHVSSWLPMSKKEVDAVVEIVNRYTD